MLGRSTKNLHMSPQTQENLLIIAISIPIGLCIGFFIRKISPNSCKAYTKWCLDGRWKLFLFGGIMFTLFSITSFCVSMPVFGFLHGFFAVLQFYALKQYGYNKLTTEQKNAIDNGTPINNINITDKIK